MHTVTVVGLGEAGAIYARGLRDAGFRVRGFDPFATISEPGIEQSDSLSEALRGSSLVISLVGAKASASVADDILSRASGPLLIADFNTGSPDLKEQLERRALSAGAQFADVAVLAPVPRSGIRTPLMVSGSGAQRFADVFRPADAPVDVVEGSSGIAAAHKLLRSAFMKGLAGVVIESMRAADRIGASDWLSGQITRELGERAPALIARLRDGSQQHAERRIHEVADTSAYLQSIGQPSWVTDAAGRWLEVLEHENEQYVSSTTKGGE